MAQSKLMTKVIWSIVYYLVDRAKEIITEARNSKDTDNVTGTQYDSYGAFVYYNGRRYYSLISADPKTDISRQKRVIETIWDEQEGRHVGWGDIPAGTGREWAKLLQSEAKTAFKVPDKGFCLIIFNAAFYSQGQETGRRYKRSYRILSQVSGRLDELKAKFRGSRLRWHNLNIK